MEASRSESSRGRWRAWLGLPACGILAVTLAGFAGGWHWLLDLTSHFRWYWLLAAIAWFAVAGRRMGRVPAACLAVATVANVLTMLPYWLPTGGPGGPADEPVRIVSLNVLVDNPHKDAVVAYLRRRPADLVVLLEVDAAWAAALRDLEPLYPHCVVEARADNFGIAVLSRLPLGRPRVERPAGGPPAIVADVGRGGAGCLFVAVHPQAPISAAWSAGRDAQLAAIGQLAAAEPRPVIVAGDLNATPWSHGFRLLIGPRGLRDTAAGRGVQATWNARRWAPRIPIDHVVVTPEVRVLSRSLGPSVGSDHLPVEVTVALP